MHLKSTTPRATTTRSRLSRPSCSILRWSRRTTTSPSSLTAATTQRQTSSRVCSTPGSGGGFSRRRCLPSRRMEEEVPVTTNILEMRSITKTFPGVKALQDVSLEVQRGHIHAICGENGAGKSTLMKVLSGVYPAGTYDGEIVLENEPVEFKNINDSEASGVVIIHQELALSPYLSIAENIFLGNEQQKNGWIDWNKTNLEASKLLARVGLKDNPITKVMDIGVGKQQLVEIAKALSKEVKLLILDEPTAALNDDDSAHLLDLIKHLKGQGITSIIISHKLN